MVRIAVPSATSYVLRVSLNGAGSVYENEVRRENYVQIQQ